MVKMNISLERLIGPTNSLNVSTDTKLERFHEELFGGPTASFLYILLLIVNHVIGPLLLGGIIAYERYGGDPQKRNIINRLQSFGLANLTMCTIIQGIVRIAREIFGLIDFDVMIWMECLFCLFLCNAIFLFSEMSIFQFLYIVVWKRVKTLNDEFLACFLIGTTNAVSVWVVLVDHLPHGMTVMNLMLHTANLDESIEETRYEVSISKKFISDH